MYMNKKYYYCYSYPLKKFLIDSGQYSIVKGIHPNSKKQYWVFERNNELDKLLTEWQVRKH